MSNKQINQTGFIAKGYNGIITSLHGVINAQKIVAINERGSVFTSLTVIKVDVENDIALLYDDRMGGGFNGGIDLSEIQTYPYNTKLLVLGHPQGIGLTNKTITAGSPFFRTLNTFIPPNSSNAFALRKSPDPFIDVIYLEGNLVPGHSGAPVLDENNKVIGVVSGGILGGAAGISWAIPLNNIKLLYKHIVIDKLNNVSHSNTDHLFTYEFLTNQLTTNDKNYLVEYFQIIDLEPVNYSFFVSDIDEIGFLDIVESKTESGMHSLIRRRVESYFSTGGGSDIIYDYMNEFWQRNTYDEILTFPPGTTMDHLKQWTYNEAVDEFSIGFSYDPKYIDIKNIYYDYNYSPYERKYIARLRDAEIEINFVSAVCGPRQRGYFSEEELEDEKFSWYRFVVIKIE